MPINIPEFIEMLREQRRAPKRKSTTQSTSKTSFTTPDPNVTLPTPTGSTSSAPVMPGANYRDPNSGGYDGVLGRMPIDMSLMWDANNLPAYGANQYNYDPMQAFNPNVGLGPGMVNPDVQMDMDWNQWDVLIQDFDSYSKYPGPGPAGGPPI